MVPQPTDGISGPGFHAWTADSGNVDFVDTWVRLPESASGTLEVRCPAEQPVARDAAEFHQARELQTREVEGA
jgi:hypothetical protein